MPITKSAKKRVRQEKKKKANNKILTTKIKKSIKDLENALNRKYKEMKYVFNKKPH